MIKPSEETSFLGPDPLADPCSGEVHNIQDVRADELGRAAIRERAWAQGAHTDEEAPTGGEMGKACMSSAVVFYLLSRMAKDVDMYDCVSKQANLGE